MVCHDNLALFTEKESIASPPASGIEREVDGQVVKHRIVMDPQLPHELFAEAFPQPLIGGEKLYGRNTFEEDGKTVEIVGWTGITLSSFGIVYNRDMLKAIGIDLVCTSSGGLKGSATNARVKRTYGYQVPYAAQIRREAEMMSIAVGLILDPALAEEILQKGEADIIAIGREALANPSWPQMAEIALGVSATEAMDHWPTQYGWWMKIRERALEQIRADG